MGTLMMGYVLRIYEILIFSKEYIHQIKCIYKFSMFYYLYSLLIVSPTIALTILFIVSPTIH